MARITFSVPDDVNERFNKAFAGHDKSRIIADLMIRAVEEQALQKRRAKPIDNLLSRRGQRRPSSAASVRKAREAGRP